MNFNVILDFFSPDIIAAIITAVVALIVGATTAFLFWWAMTKQEKQQQKQHEEKMEYIRLKYELKKEDLNLKQKAFIEKYENKKLQTGKMISENLKHS